MDATTTAHTCRKCGRPIARADKRVKYCSDNCYQSVQREQLVKSRRKQHIEKYKDRTCESCGKAVDAEVSGHASMCLECAAALFTQQRLRKQRRFCGTSPDGTGIRRHKRTDRPCVECGKVVSMGGPQKRCDVCAYKRHIKDARKAYRRRVQRQSGADTPSSS